MNAIEFLEGQHADIEALLERLEKADAGADKTELFERLAGALVGHDVIEREIFYPACSETMGMTDLLGEALAAHGIVELCLYLTDEARGAVDFDFKLKALADTVKHHLGEEEREFFPKVERAIEPDRLAVLGSEMRARFEEVTTRRFRAVLHENVRQVLAGALETAPKEALAGARRAAS